MRDDGARWAKAFPGAVDHVRNANPARTSDFQRAPQPHQPARARLVAKRHPSPVRPSCSCDQTSLETVRGCLGTTLQRLRRTLSGRRLRPGCALDQPEP